MLMLMLILILILTAEMNLQGPKLMRAQTEGEDSLGPRAPNLSGDISQTADQKNRGENWPAATKDSNFARKFLLS